MKYAIIDQIRGGDQFEEIFDTAEEAVRYADDEWSRLTDHDKARRDYFAVMSGELDEDGCFDQNTGRMVKEYKCEDNA